VKTIAGEKSQELPMNLDQTEYTIFGITIRIDFNFVCHVTIFAYIVVISSSSLV
jgi:hypothetical protein